MDHTQPTPGVLFNPHHHHDRVWGELRELGVSNLGLMWTDNRHVPQIIHSDEHIKGVIYGYQLDGFVMLLATDRRVVFLDKKLFYVNEDEIGYDSVIGVGVNRIGSGSTVTLHTRVKDYVIRTFNKKCAAQFVEYIEKRCLERPIEEEK